MTISAIVAIGNQGQVGLNGRLPWHDPDDLKWFRDKTMGKACVVGWNTAQTLPELPGRHVYVCNGAPPSKNRNPRAEVIIIGGPKTYARWAHLIDHWYVSAIDYSGPADTFFDMELLKNAQITWRNGKAIHIG